MTGVLNPVGHVVLMPKPRLGLYQNARSEKNPTCSWWIDAPRSGFLRFVQVHHASRMHGSHGESWAQGLQSDHATCFAPRGK